MASVEEREVKRGKEKKKKSSTNSAIEFVVIIAVALGLAVGIQAFLVKPYRIPSPSMVPTLEIGQRVLVNRIGHVFSKPSIGDVVVFPPPLRAEEQVCGVSHPEDEPCPRPEKRHADTNFIK